jgi:glycosyltransferase involved in cell wall biosynthesis
MLLKVPVIVRNIDGNKEIVKHKETGLLFSNPEVQLQLSFLIGAHDF